MGNSYSYVSTPFKFMATLVPVLAVGFMIGLYHFQTKLIYASNFPEHSRTQVDNPRRYKIDYEDVTIETHDGEKLTGYLMYQKSDKTILMLNPNAGNIGHSLPLAEMFYKKMGYNVVTYSYRGYGHSTGIANEKGLKIDAQEVIKWMNKDERINKTKVILYGRSLGGAVAFHIASSNDELIEALIVENTFLSIPKVVPNVLPWLGPLVFLCTEKWETEILISSINSKLPILFLSGSRDELVPPRHMTRLYKLSKSENKQFEKFQKGTHNDTTIQPEYWEVIHEFIGNNVSPYEDVRYQIIAARKERERESEHSSNERESDEKEKEKES